MSRIAPSTTLDVLTHNWWSLVARGAAAILFGAAVVLAPELTLDGLARLFAVYAITDGGLTLVAGLQERERGQRWGALLLAGAAGVAVGVLTLAWSTLSVSSLLFLIGAWAIVAGVLQVVAVLRLGYFRRGESLLASAGVVSALFGAVLVLSPVTGVSALGLSIAAYALGFGGLLIVLGMRLRKRSTAGGAWRARLEPEVSR